MARVGIRCLISIGLVAGFAAGLNDGRILIYDLANFQLITALRPPKPSLEFGAVARLCVIMPPDDPKPCFYICAMYQGLSLSMLLHSVNYSYVRHDGFGYRFEVSVWRRLEHNIKFNSIHSNKKFGNRQF